MTIEQILRNYDGKYDKIKLDYEGQVEEFESEWDLDDSLYEEEARAKLRKKTLEITVR